jgi:hypothetical protein
VFKTSDRFALAMMKRSAPTLLTYGGNYATMKNLRVENVLPFAFPYGIGGPKMKRRVPVSDENCIQRYFRTAMTQFMRSDVVLVLHHIYSRQMSFQSGVMSSRSRINGESVGELLGRSSIHDFECVLSSSDDNNINSSSPAGVILKAIRTSCRALGYTDEAAKEGRKNHFALMDMFGVNSLFLSISPCDESSFRVRLFANPNKWVS